MSSEVINLENFNEQDMLSDDIKVYIVATHGEGEPTGNAQAFYYWMKKCVKNGVKDVVKGDFIVFGLGDS